MIRWLLSILLIAPFTRAAEPSGADAWLDRARGDVLQCAKQSIATPLPGPIELTAAIVWARGNEPDRAFAREVMHVPIVQPPGVDPVSAELAVKCTKAEVLAALGDKQQARQLLDDVANQPLKDALPPFAQQMEAMVVGRGYALLGEQDRALEILNQHPLLDDPTSSYDWLALSYEGAGMRDKRDEMLREIKRRALAQKDPKEVGGALRSLCRTQIKLNLLDESLGTAKEIPLDYHRVDMLRSLIDAFAAVGREKEVDQCLKLELDAATNLKEPETWVEITSDAASVNRPDICAQAAKAAEATLNNLGTGAVYYWPRLATAYAAINDQAAADRCIANATKLVERQESAADKTRTWFRIAAAYARRGDIQSADKSIGEAVRIGGEPDLSVSDEFASVLSAYIARADFDQAVATAKPAFKDPKDFDYVYEQIVSARIKRREWAPSVDAALKITPARRIRSLVRIARAQTVIGDIQSLQQWVSKLTSPKERAIVEIAIAYRLLGRQSTVDRLYGDQ